MVKKIVNKKVVHTFKKPILVFSRKEEFPPRIQSAPPISQVTLSSEKNPSTFELRNSDGSVFVLDEDVSSSSEEVVEDLKVDEAVIEAVDEVLVEAVMEDEIKEESPVQESVTPTSATQLVEDIQLSDPTTLRSEPTTSRSEPITLSSETTTPMTESTLQSDHQIYIDYKNDYYVGEVPQETRSLFSVFAAKFPWKQESEPVKYRMQEIIECKERMPIVINIRRKPEAKPKPKIKGYVIKEVTIVDKGRFEINKLCLSNVKKIVANFKSLKVEKIADMKEIAKILFEKSQTEHQFAVPYSTLILEIKDSWKCEEEKKMNVHQTVFFGTFLSLSVKYLKENITWADEKLEEEMKKILPNRKKYERAQEDYEADRQLRKNSTLGIIKILSTLYCINVISIKHIGDILDFYLKDLNVENIEKICTLLIFVGGKLLVSNRGDIFNKMVSVLKAEKFKHNNMVRFLIEDTLERAEALVRTAKYKEPKVKKSTNTFSGMKIGLGAETSSEDEEVVMMVKKSPSPVEEDMEEDNMEEILGAISAMADDMKMAQNEDDRIMAADGFKRGIGKYGKELFMTNYITESISNFKKSDDLIGLFLECYGMTGLDESGLVGILKNIKADLKYLKVDFPISPKKYEELVNKLVEVGKIGRTEYEELKG